MWTVRLRGWIAVIVACTSLARGTAATPTEGPVRFETHVRPILKAYCFDCHGGAEEKEAGLDLRLVRFQMQGGENGPVLVPGDPQASRLVERIRQGEMPPGDGKVPAAQLAVLEAWVAAGAPTLRPEPESLPPGVGISEEERRWWAFQPIRPVPVPVADNPRVRGAIDALLQSEMPEGLSFSDDADRPTLIKRATLDLWGLPPSEEEVARFLADDAPDAYEQLVERLLASPHYGERWARHWLDVAGYADSDGGTSQDAPRPWAYKYRDYVIRSFNADKPLDRFLAEQLAGDELAGPVQGDLTAEQMELLTATGFLRMAADGTGSGDDSPEARNQVLVDTLKIVSSSLLGVTLACAQCHDHRYDPIPQSDYYALRAVFEPALDWQDWKMPAQRLISLYTAADRERAAQLEAEAQQIAAERKMLETRYLAEARDKELAKYDEPLRSQLRAAFDTPAEQRTAEQQKLVELNPSLNISAGVLYQFNQAAADELKKFDDKANEVRGRKPPEEFLLALVEPAEHLPATRRFHRGDYRQPQEEVGPGALSVLGSDSGRPAFAVRDGERATSGRRLALARWLTSAENPLTPRVMVNRIWMQHMGRALVATPADFGRLGSEPTHPELLDWLADAWRQHGWSCKWLHREIMHSTAYRQRSSREPARDALDGINRYYTRQNVVRLDAETLRDRVLAVSGALDATLYGPAVGVKEDETGQVVVDGPGQRRSLYITQRRTMPVALMQAFDAPVMQTNCEVRPSSTVATQSLMLLNGSFSVEQAWRMSERLLREAAPPCPAELTADMDPPTQSWSETWQFGYGAVRADGGVTFQRLPHGTGTRWQGGADLPDGTLGWVMVSAQGGHPGSGAERAAIRRWTAPAAGEVQVRGRLAHASEHGDGVRGWLISCRAGVLGAWVVQHGEVVTDAPRFTVEVGDTIDWVVDCREHETSDSFTWEVEVSLLAAGSPAQTWNSVAGFYGAPLPARVTLDHVARAWQLAYLRLPARDELAAAAAFVRDQADWLRSHPEDCPPEHPADAQALAHLCHVLLNSNEFLYVD